VYAIIKAAGKQYRVSEQDVIDIDKLAVGEGEKVVIDQVLLVSDDNKGVKVGAPYVDGATVTARVVRHYKGKKIRGFTYKPKKDYRRRYGHRQQLTSVAIEKIDVGNN